MGLDQNNNYVDDRTSVIFQGIKEETIALKRSESVKDAISMLREGGTEISRSEKTDSAETVRSSIERNREEYEEVQPNPATKATGKVTVSADPGTTIPKGTRFGTDDAKKFISTEEVTAGRGGQAKVPVEANTAGTEGNVGVGEIDSILGIVSGVNSVRNLEPTTGGTKKEELSPIDQARSNSISSTITDLERGLRDIESDIGELQDQGILGEGEYTVKFIYDQPNVSVSTTNRFVEHETVDGPVIRQRVGTGKKNVTLEGVCTTAEASLLDNFVNEDQIYVKSNRYEGNVSIQSISTSPLEDGGAMNLDGKYTHDFGLELTEIEQ